MKKLFYVGALLALLLAACGDTTDTESSTKDDVAEEEIEKDDYKEVGTDIEAGEYLIISDDSESYVEVAKDNTGASESIVYNAHLEKDEHMYLTISNGQYLNIEDAEIYSLADAPSIIPEDGVYQNGQFKVGTDIPAGEYTYIVDKNDSSAFIEVSTSSIYDVDNIILSETPTVNGSVTLTDGQYLTLQNVHIEIK